VQRLLLVHCLGCRAGNQYAVGLILWVWLIDFDAIAPVLQQRGALSVHCSAVRADQECMDGSVPQCLAGTFQNIAFQSLDVHLAQISPTSDDRQNRIQGMRRDVRRAPRLPQASCDEHRVHRRSEALITDGRAALNRRHKPVFDEHGAPVGLGCAKVMECKIILYSSIQ
jgi:hypothetical protein